MTKLLTPHELARRLDMSVHLVRSFLESIHSIAPHAWVDGIPIYGAEAFDRLKEELAALNHAEIKAEREEVVDETR
jgi:hypothetical protein